MRLVYLGNGPFAAPALAALAKTDHEILCVVARPDRPQGRHMQIETGPVASLAKGLGLPLHQPESANAPDFVVQLKTLAADLLVVADFGQILSADCLGTTRLGGINIHGSLLPKYRGAAPIAWAIYNGDPETGVSVLQMTPKMDAGGVILRKTTPIGRDETSFDVEQRLSALGAEAALEAVSLLQEHKAVPEPQAPEQVTKAPKLKKEDGRIDWKRTAQQIHDQIRSMQPWPMAACEWTRGPGKVVRLLVLKSVVVERDSTGEPGVVAAADAKTLHVQTGQGALSLLEVQPAGKNRMTIEEFQRGYRLAPGGRID